MLLKEIIDTETLDPRKDLKPWEDLGFTYELAKKWFMAGFNNPSYAHSWHEFFDDPYKAFYWYKQGYYPKTAKQMSDIKTESYEQYKPYFDWLNLRNMSLLPMTDLAVIKAMMQRFDMHGGLAFVTAKTILDAWRAQK